MLQALINTLSKWDWFYSTSFIKDFEYLIRDVKIHTWYSLKFDVNRSKFKDYVRENVNYDLFQSDLSDLSKIELCNDYIENVAQRWYEVYLDEKTLIKSNSSLKSDSKRWYKNKINRELKNFDRFMEEIYRLYNEAYNVYEIIFYSPDALKKNTKFVADRGSCFLNGRKDYFTVISQLPSFYVLIYKNGEPLTRCWGVLDKHRENIVFFNPYGHKFKRLDKFFGVDDEFKSVNADSLEHRLAVYVNEDGLMSKDGVLDNFIYRVECPSCGSLVDTDKLEWDDGLHCPDCNSHRVWSSYNECYIDEEEACWSEIYEDWFYRDQVVYSYYHDDYILERHAYRVYNYDIDAIDYVIRDEAVYSEYSDEWLIKSQCVYSDYYDTYLLKTDTVKYSHWLDTYIDSEDPDIIIIDGDYIPLEDIEEYIQRNKIKQLKSV